MSQLGSIVEGLAANRLGLDVVEVTQRPDGAIVATFGTYLTNRVFASVSPVLTPSSSSARGEDESRFEATLEYQLLNWLLLQLEQRNQGGTGGSAQIEFAY